LLLVVDILDPTAAATNETQALLTNVVLRAEISQSQKLIVLLKHSFFDISEYVASEW